MSNAVFHHPHRVTYAECTVGDHIYHARYLDLLEAARGEFLRHLGLTVRQLQEADTIFPVIGAQVDYKAPARYDDLLRIEVLDPGAELFSIAGHDGVAHARRGLPTSWRCSRARSPATGRLACPETRREVSAASEGRRTHRMDRCAPRTAWCRAAGCRRT